MKKFLTLLVVSKLFVASALSQPFAGLKLSTDKPETGREVSFVYTGIFSKKVDPWITLYYEKKGGIQWMTLKNLKHSANGIEGTFLIPDSALAICLKPRNNRDTTEGFIYPVFKDGNQLKGSRMAAAMFYTNSAQGLINYAQAKALYDEEFLLYPELKPKYLLNYYEAPFNPPSTIDVLEKIWADSVATGSGEAFLNRLYRLMTRRNQNIYKRLKAELITKYPNGDYAFLEAARDVSVNPLNARDVTYGLAALEIKFAPLIPLGKFDEVYYLVAQKLFSLGDIDGADEYIQKVKSKTRQKEFYSGRALSLLAEGRELEKAELFVQKAIGLLSAQPMPYYVFDKQSWQQSLDYMKATYLDFSAQIQYKMGNKAEALNRLKTALQMNNENNRVREHYLKYLLDAGNAKEAMTASSKYIEANQATDIINQLLKDAYSKSMGSPNGYDAYYKGVVKKADEKYTLPDFSYLNVNSLDFTLMGTDGKPVSLSAFKGKPVVLYFFRISYPNAQNDAFNSEFNKIVKDHGSKTVFLAIDETSVSEADEANGKLARIANINAFMTKNNFSFKVLMDDFHRNERWTGGSFYRVMDLYSADSICQFYLIDKNGMVKYKSYPYTPLPVDKFRREFIKALTLID